MIKTIFLILFFLTSQDIWASECSDHTGIQEPQIKEYFSNFDLIKHDEEYLGHTMERHLGKSKDWLEGRLSGDRHRKFASSYTDAATANEAIKTIVLENQEKIKQWLEGKESKKRLTLSKDMEKKLGILVARGGKEVKDCNIAVVVLKRKERDKSFFLLTSYPVANKTDLEEYRRNLNLKKDKYGNS
jgi:hypothetical protein